VRERLKSTTRRMTGDCRVRICERLEVKFLRPTRRAYQGQGDTIREAAPKAQEMTSRRTRYKQIVDELQQKKNRAKVEHPFRILKRVFRFAKVRFRGLKKNHNHLCAAFPLVNLYVHRKRLDLGGA
jgi:hypothetical protein